MVINLKNKIMKKLLALSFILATLSVGANAQSKDAKSETINAQTQTPRNHPKMKGRKGGEKIKKELNLTTDQQNQMKELNQSFKTRKDAIKNNTSLSKEAQIEQLKALHAEKKTKMAAILTPDQQKKMQEMKANRQNHPGRKSKK